MSASAVQAQSSKNLPTQKAAPTKPISWLDFQKKYLSREDGFKYEWLNGQVEKTIRGMDKTQLYIQRNFLRFFRELLKNGKVEGEMIAEPDLFFLKNHRRPDMVWLTDEQINRLATPEAYEVPEFVIEVISMNDQMNKVRDKMINYRDAGVQVVWHIFPNTQEVDVYSGKNLASVKVCTQGDICSAEPVLPEFKMPVKAIFEK